MDVKIQWENASRTVLRYTLTGSWNWEQFYTIFEQQIKIPAPCDHRLCILIDLRAVTYIPSDAILHLKRAAQMAQTLGGMIVVIATSVTTTTLYCLFVSMYKSAGAQFRLASTIEEAHALLGFSL